MFYSQDVLENVVANRGGGGVLFNCAFFSFLNVFVFKYVLEKRFVDRGGGGVSINVASYSIPCNSTHF